MDDVSEGKDFSFPKQEEKILEWWTEVKAFETQLEKTKDLPEYIFYDGPPFATGLPHYGHILAGTIKDIVTRYQTMTGHHVTRRFGWDCHGLPVEHEIDVKLGIKTREDVIKMGIGNYNEECRTIVTRYVGEWEKVITRTGRWIDFKNDYKTMDLNFMESVWWVFSQLFKKNLVYRGFKVSSSSDLFCLFYLQITSFNSEFGKLNIVNSILHLLYKMCNTVLWRCCSFNRSCPTVQAARLHCQISRLIQTTRFELIFYPLFSIQTILNPFASPLIC